VIVTIGDGWAVALSSLTWFMTSLVVGKIAVTWTADRVARTGPFTTIRSWEHGGSFWQRHLRVRRWKGRLPEAGAFFAGGTSKAHVGSRDTAVLRTFRGETVRAERVHWLIMASTPIHFVWCRPTLAAFMVVFGVGFNAPFIVVQRYNRGRLDKVLSRREPV